MVSVTLVTAAVLLTSNFSKSPPVVPVTVTLRSSASTYTSSLGASMVIEASFEPAAMVIVSPLLSLITRSVRVGHRQDSFRKTPICTCR
ncbi:hypothetical protein V0R49_26375 [Pseudomonas inefficax]|nr:hypothetical protein [Pseudomonas inefficax]